MRTTIILAVVAATDATKDAELVDLATRLGNALERRGREATITVISRWTTANAPTTSTAVEGLVDEVFKKAQAAAQKPHGNEPGKEGSST